MKKKNEWTSKLMWRVGGDNRAIGYDYDFLENPTDDSDGSIEDYLMTP